MALRESDQKNFDTLVTANKANRLCLMESRDKVTGEYRALVCAMNVKDGNYMPVPLAVMVWDNPYEQFEDPTLPELPPAKEPTT